jgi:class 3 adenylate cyclase/streptogramin lyase
MSDRRIATVVMLDIVGSTEVAAQMGDARYRELSSRFARSVRAGIKRFGGREEDNAGDGFFATFPQPDRGIRFATSLADEVRELGIEIRSGVHTGQTERLDRKTQGIAVVIGARVMSLAGPGEVLVTSTTKELVTGSGFGFEDFSAHELKGVPGTWQMFAVTSVDDRERTPPLSTDEAARRLDGIEASRGGAPRSRRALLAGGLAGIVTVVAIAFALLRDNEPPPAGSSAPASKSLVNVDPDTGAILAEIAVPDPEQAGPVATHPTSVHPMDVGQAAVWTIRSYSTLHRVDPGGNLIEHETLEGGLSAPYGVAVGYDKVWISCARGLIEVNPATMDQRWPVALDAEGSQFGTDLAIGGGAVWVGVSDGELIRVDPSTEQWDRWEEDLAPIDAIAFGHGSVWTADTFGGSVTRYDADTLEPLATIRIANGVDTLVSGEDAVWALSLGLGVLTEIDVSENRADHIVQVGTSPSGLAAGQGMVWVGHESGTLRRIDEATRQPTDVPFDAEIRALAFDDETDTLWVDVA